MSNIHIITPVKDSLATTLRTIDHILQSETECSTEYVVYNDFSSDVNTTLLQNKSTENKFALINLHELTSHATPNYTLVLQMAQKKALEAGAHLLIIESDVFIKPDTIKQLSHYANQLYRPGLIAALTTDGKGKTVFPYLYARKYKKGVIETRKRLSFCCTLITHSFLKEYNFDNLDPRKSWHDVFISHKAVDLGFRNYLITSLHVTHLPHSSRPWKQLKYSNPLKYYLKKLIHNKDKI